MLSQKARYALRAMMVLAEAAPGTPTMTGELATRAVVPKKFLEQILLALKAAGLVFSTRGRSGGYALAAPTDKIDFAAIVRAIDGPLALAPCASRTAYRRCDDCLDVETCDIRRALIEVRDATATILEGRTLAEALQLRRRKIKAA
ncbi:MAG: Rrf2 family transcriptional regulator [Alphaproteobacteria bacterium]|nr:Rrf2 family transcriptional regulator [Alphaproteobacteria bacterium]